VVLGFEHTQYLYDAVLVGLASDDAYVGMSPCLPDQMLPAAETDLEPNLRNVFLKLDGWMLR
jgi:hypothetical protein